MPSSPDANGCATRTSRCGQRRSWGRRSTGRPSTCGPAERPCGGPPGAAHVAALHRRDEYQTPPGAALPSAAAAATRGVLHLADELLQDVLQEEHRRRLAAHVTHLRQVTA